jgi:thiamine-phosphate pyrophosphorylase
MTRSLADLVHGLNFRGHPAWLPRLILMTDAVRLPDPRPHLDRLPAGSLVIVRHPDASIRRDLTRDLLPLCRQRRLRLSVAADPGLAISLGIGLHLPEAMTRTASARIRLWHRMRGLPVTAAAHSRVALRRAARVGADAAVLSPVFATLSHPGASVLGPLRFRRLALTAPVPVFALGGISTATVRRLSGGRMVGVATVGGLG